MLLPMLKLGERPADAADWVEQTALTVERGLAHLRTPSNDEVRFLDFVAIRGEIEPELLGVPRDDPMHAAMLASPVLRWKADNAKRHHGGSNP
jgi:hypothetical protein